MTTTATSTAERRAGSLELGFAQGGLEVRQFLRSREQVMFTLAFPAIMILVFGSIFKGEIGDGVKFTQYFVTGMIGTGLMTAGFQALAIQIPMERDRGVLKRFLGTPMPKWVYFAGKVPPGWAGPAATKPAFVSTFREAAFCSATAARRVRSPCRSAASRHSSRTVEVATPRPATCCATR